jgi:mannose-1-phosphate guanylyltransferase
MVLAAGLGQRMRPLSLLRAKPVLPVLNRPLLHWTLELLARAGVREVVINLHHLPGTVRRAVGNGRALGLAVTYSYERRILGTGGGPRRVRDFFGDEPFLLVNGDVLFDFDLRALLERHHRSGARATLALRPNPDPARYSPVVTGPDGRIRSLAGRPRAARGRASLFTGIHVLDPALLERLPAGPSDSVRDLYLPMLEAGERLLGVRQRGAWYDLGSPSLYLASQVAALVRGFRHLRQGSAVHPLARVHPRAHLSRSVVGARTVVEPGAEVASSVLWDGVRIERGARVQRAIVTTGGRVGAGDVLSNAMVVPAGRADRSRRGGRRRPKWQRVPLG